MNKRKQSGEVLYRVIHDPGVHIASSHKTEGRFRANLLDDDTNKPDGFAELEPVDDSEYGYGSSYDNQENQQECKFRSNRTVKRSMPHSGKGNRLVKIL